MALFSQTKDFLSQSVSQPHGQLSLFAVAGASFSLGLVFYRLIASSAAPEILPSPRLTLLPNLSDSEKSALALPPDVLPGARDVPTPYGTIRVYEWGPEDGKKVLFIHGITTPCIALGDVAHHLAHNGCRVMLFDLFGRGYSDLPTDVPQDLRLFATQIFLVLSSSPLSWTGSGSDRFSLVGYSLGGGIAASFTSYFPDLISSLILLAPAGLIRDSQISFKSRLLYSPSILPERFLRFLVDRRLRAGPLSKQRPSRPEDQKLDVETVVNAEVPQKEQIPGMVTLSTTHPNVTIGGSVSFQLHHHPGFVRAFMSSIRHAPIFGQYETWKRIGQRLSGQQDMSPSERQTAGLHNGKVLIIYGKHDTTILAEHLVEDASLYLEGNVVFRDLEAGHEFPVSNSHDVATFISDFWAQ
ncbi:hypothetical protein FQN54_003732 [Arachnomyces sp. PD_36]|nr:hypothetical protein FQN54_003732 [Arachnomyces sp. PD_36]